jgi:hypothetical protein
VDSSAASSPSSSAAFLSFARLFWNLLHWNTSKRHRPQQETQKPLATTYAHT